MLNKYHLFASLILLKLLLITPVNAKGKNKYKMYFKWSVWCDHNSCKLQCLREGRMRYRRQEVRQVSVFRRGVFAFVSGSHLRSVRDQRHHSDVTCT